MNAEQRQYHRSLVGTWVRIEGEDLHPWMNGQAGVVRRVHSGNLMCIVNAEGLEILVYACFLTPVNRVNP